MRERAHLSNYCVVSVWFGCNSRCTICMLSRVQERLPAISLERFKAVTTEVARQGRYRNLILSGGEVTTFGDLERYVRFAASLGYFEKLQIQTNGRRLADKRYLERLVDSGVNEFFVSVHGLGEVHDTITRSPGSFRQVEEAFANLEHFDVTVISNTVLTKENYHDIAPLVAFLGRLRIDEMQVWNFFPMERTDSGDLVVSLGDVAQLLQVLTPLAAAAGKPLVLKSFPHCLPVRAPVALDSFFPVTVLPDLFWKQFSECGFGRCAHREAGRCDEWPCWGLSSAYIEKYGDERQMLRPITSVCCQGAKNGG